MSALGRCDLPAAGREHVRSARSAGEGEGGEGCQGVRLGYGVGDYVEDQDQVPSLALLGKEKKQGPVWGSPAAALP